MPNEMDFTFLNRLNEGDKIRLNAVRFGELVLVRADEKIEYNLPAKFYSYDFNLEGETDRKRPGYRLHVWVDLDPAAPPGLRDEQIRQNAKDASLMDLTSRLSGKVVSLERLD